MKAKEIFARRCRSWSRAVGKVWWRLTHHTDCAWCNKRMRHALIPLPPQRFTSTVVIPRVSHSICPECAEREVRKAFDLWTVPQEVQSKINEGKMANPNAGVVQAFPNGRW